MKLSPLLTLAAASMCVAGVSSPAGAAEPSSLKLTDVHLEAPSGRTAGRPRSTKPSGNRSVWLGIGAGALTGSVEYDDTLGNSRTESGAFETYTANVTLAGPVALRLRGVRSANRQDGRTPYELATLVGGRFGNSPWYGLVGFGRVRHADNDAPEQSQGFAWEILFAPGQRAGAGFELSFQGHRDEHVDFISISAGLRLGN